MKWIIVGMLISANVMAGGQRNTPPDITNNTNHNSLLGVNHNYNANNNTNRNHNLNTNTNLNNNANRNDNLNQNINNTSSNARSNSNASSDADANSYAGAYSNTGPSTSSSRNDLTIESQQERIQHIVGSTNSNCIGTVCRATTALTITGGYDEMTGNSVNIGVVIPLGGSAKTTNGAMNVEYQYMQDRNLRAKERHQGEMAQMCMLLHEQLNITPEKSPELWDRCYAYVPHKNHVATGVAHPHNGDENPFQASPHR